MKNLSKILKAFTKGNNYTSDEIIVKGSYEGSALYLRQPGESQPSDFKQIASFFDGKLSISSVEYFSVKYGDMIQAILKDYKINEQIHWKTGQWYLGDVPLWVSRSFRIYKPIDNGSYTIGFIEGLSTVMVLSGEQQRKYLELCAFYGRTPDEGIANKVKSKNTDHE